MATNVVASWPPQRQPTGTPTARANKNFQLEGLGLLRKCWPENEYNIKTKDNYRYEVDPENDDDLKTKIT